MLFAPPRGYQDCWSVSASHQCHINPEIRKQAPGQRSIPFLPSITVVAMSFVQKLRSLPKVLNQKVEVLVTSADKYSGCSFNSLLFYGISGVKALGTESGHVWVLHQLNNACCRTVKDLPYF
ncbi:deoxyhypusine hydroxylase [Platysternon megacephalum]|uniref:Deoxyhypusine hydroxylase n=1 Tax=Platysternon megacephalum TaxID=55544 RepID=A0A4D9E582_9SAUR|nr:deoxyhypusine hydroxylase [Platysternon megacephalum]